MAGDVAGSSVLLSRLPVVRSKPALGTVGLVLTPRPIEPVLVPAIEAGLQNCLEPCT